MQGDDKAVVRWCGAGLAKGFPDAATDGSLGHGSGAPSGRLGVVVLIFTSTSAAARATSSSSCSGSAWSSTVSWRGSCASSSSPSASWYLRCGWRYGCGIGGVGAPLLFLPLLLFLSSLSDLLCYSWRWGKVWAAVVVRKRRAQVVAAADWSKEEQLLAVDS
ncbi:unnamed protein product [Urochloa humidicola]